jgi:resuscitation-promoting factor RpfB
MPGNINGFTLGYTVIGAIVMWSGITGTSLTTTAKDLISGKAPTQDEEAITGTSTTTTTAATAPAAGNTGASTATAAANQATAKLLAAPYGWSVGTQWADLVSLWNQESGWNNTADNPTSGAYGIAQALPPTKYPAAGQAPPVGSSSAIAQISWGLSYISSTYGSPSAAWAHEIANNWY